MKKPYVLGVIPARLASTRLPRKLLLPIGGRPVLEHTYRQALRARQLDDLIVATDSGEIKRAAERFGATVVMTAKAHKTGSDRIAEAVRRYRGRRPDIVVNIQGDEPLVPPQLIDAVVRKLASRSQLDAVAAASSGVRDEDFRESSVVKVACDKTGSALFFTRHDIPFVHVPGESRVTLAVIGLTGFRRAFLETYVKLPRGPLERVESVEQLRILEHGYRCGVVSGKFDIIGVNTPSEYEKVKRIIERT